MPRNNLFVRLLLIFNMFALNVSAQYNFEWATNIEATGGFSNGNHALSITTDATGNVYELGRFSGSADFDPGTGISSAVSQGGVDIYIRKLSTTGDFIWAIQFGGPDIDMGTEIVIDAFGDILVTGYFEDTIDVDPGPGVLNFIPNNSIGLEDGFLLKLDANGNFLWAKQLGGLSADYINSLATDNLGNIYTSGSFRNTVDFDPGPGVYNLTANSFSAFVQKLDVNGNFIWAKMMAGSSGCTARNLMLDGNGSLYVCGAFQGLVDFDPSSNVFNLTSLGGYDAFVQKMDTSGNWIWTKGWGNVGYDFALDMAIDNAGDVLISGEFEDAVDFNPGPGVESLASQGGRDGFVLKLDSAGDFIWANVFGGTEIDRATSLVIDADNAIYTTGWFKGTVDFDPGPGVFNLTATVSYACFTQAYSSLGDLLWAYRLGGNGGSYGTALTLDPNENIFATGNYSGTTDFDPSVVNYSLSSYATSNSYVFKLRRCQPTTGTDVHVTCDSLNWIDGNTYTASNTTATWLLTNADGCDSLVTLDLTVNYSSTGTDLQTACDSFIWIDGITYTSSNNSATWTLTNAQGCDSLVSLDLTINNSSNITDSYTTCDSFTWIDGNTYTSSNNSATWPLQTTSGCDSIITLDLTINSSISATDIQSDCSTFDWIDGNTYTSSNNTATWLLSTAAGCDSLVTLDLTINYPTTGTDVQSACDAFTWIDGITYTASNTSAIWTLTNAGGCDSIVTLDLTMNNSSTGTDVQSACGSYSWIDGNTYTSSNSSALWILPNAHGCDSLVMLDLSIYPMPNINVTSSGSLLGATQIGAVYQWLDCDDDYNPIAGETNSDFSPTAIVGNYAVQIELNGCTDTSACYLVDFTDLSSLDQDTLKLSPNPAHDQITIVGLEKVSGLQGAEVRSSNGQLAFTTTHVDQPLNVSHLESGVYFIRLFHHNGVNTLRFIKQ